MNKKEIISRAYNIYGDKYSYELVPDEVKSYSKIQIIRKEHGVFVKSLTKHINGCQGCPSCSGKFRYNTETFIGKASKLPHCSKYSFEEVNYVNNKTDILVFCHETDGEGNAHGYFSITPGHLLSGEGCPVCRYIKSANSKRRNIDDVISEARKIHGDKYDYSLITEYKNDRVKYKIICPTHGVFEQTMNNHIKGKQGCPVCGRTKCDEKKNH